MIEAQRDLLHNSYNKDEMTILVTDSGLGGISVAAQLYQRLQKGSTCKKVKIIFFNALFDADSGYSCLTSRDKKVEIFNAALYGMERYEADVISIACNTLSVLYPSTVFSQTTARPVIGIVEIGAEYVLQSVESDDNAAVILFATPTTIEEGTHKQLLKTEAPSLHIIEQPCPDLATVIGDGYPDSERRQLIHDYVKQALQKLPKDFSTVYASLNCTHYGYYEDEFRLTFRENGFADVRLLNPNSRMAQLLIPPDAQTTNPDAEIRIEFVSKVNFPPNGVKILSPLLATYSQDVVSAFHNYHHDIHLF
ncbi:MAG: hypothetical protein GY801_13910 [bacterium]|nr:hypothetical protein [bacterium]